VVVPEKATLAGRTAARLVYALVRVVDLTLRYRLDDPAGAINTVRRGRVIFAAWHNRLALSMPVYRRLVGHGPEVRRMAAMVSASRDGGFLARVMELFGGQPVRGSSSRRGPQAVLEMVSSAERGYDLAITPDGPRGPRHVVQSGVIDVAALSGLPIVPVGYDLSRRFVSNSWDRFLVPCPFVRCVIRLGAPLHVPREATPAEREALRRELESRLAALTDLPTDSPGPAPAKA
jgi:hypothetical protein